MALNFIEPEKSDLTPRITVFGVGGAGGNAVNNMIEQQLEGVEFVVANTDAQALQQSRAANRIQLGVKVTEGLGAGARPSIGASAAEETLEEIIDHLAGSHMCFITAGMGGGTGTGAAPIIAQAARELGVLTVGVVTKPFAFEGAKRKRQAEEGVEALQQVVDTLIIIPNQNLFRLATERTTFAEAFTMADDVLYQGVKGVTDLMVRPGVINLDFADVRSVMDEMGKAMMGTGEASGEDRARQAAEKAIANPLLDEISLNGARGVLINITGGNDLTLYELDEAANLIREKVDAEANIIVGSTLDPEMEGGIRVSVVATGIEASADAQSLDVQRRRLAEPLSGAAPAAIAAEEQSPTHFVPESEAATPMFEEPQAETAQIDAFETFEPEPQPEMVEHYVEPRAERAVERPVEYAPMPAQTQYQQPQAAHHIPGRSASAGQPVQDEFDLDEILDDVPQQVRPVVRMAPAPQPETHMAQSQNAPRPAAGQPSPETLARLRAAVMKAPEEARREQGFRDEYREQPRPVAPQHRAPIAAAPQPQPPVLHAQPHAQPQQAEHQQSQHQQAERSRFGGFGSLINRMTGAASEAPAHRSAPSAPRAQAQMHAYDDESYEVNDADRVEIPAFLRRQAN